MSEIGGNLKNIVMKSIEVLGNKANNIASSAKQKVEEYNLANEQKDLFCTIGSKVLELSKQGVAFPDELKEDLRKAAEIGEELERIRAEREAAEKAKAEKEKEEAEKEEAEQEETEPREAPAEEIKTFAPTAIDYAAQNDRDVPVIKVDEAEEDEESLFADCPMSSAINDLFEQMPPVDKMMDKVNSSLDELGENLRKFSGDFDRQLNEFTDQMMGKDDKDSQDRN